MGVAGGGAAQAWGLVRGCLGQVRAEVAVVPVSCCADVLAGCAAVPALAGFDVDAEPDSLISRLASASTASVSGSRCSGLVIHRQRTFISGSRMKRDRRGTPS